MKIGPWEIIKKRSLEDPNRQITLDDIVGGVRVSSGQSVTPGAAMGLSAVLACVRVLAESVASLAWITYERVGANGKTRAQDHPVYDLLHSRPNPIMSSFNFRERMMGDLLLHGNFYALIDWNGSGYPGALWPLATSAITPFIINSGRGIAYRIRTESGFARDYQSGNVLHVAALGDGLVGRGLIAYAAESIGTALSQELFAGSYYGNGAHPGGVIETDNKLDETIQERLKKGWAQAYGRTDGNVGWHRVAILEDGLKWKPMTVNPKDAMLLESRKFQIEDIARIFLIPPHMIADLEHATFSNIEHQSIDFVVHTLMPWCTRIEQEVNYKLFLPDERKKIFSEFLFDSMLRGDAKSRNEAYQIMRRNGVLNADEWREMENRNPLPDGQGEKYIIESNMQSLDQVGKENTK